MILNHLKNLNIGTTSIKIPLIKSSLFKGSSETPEIRKLPSTIDIYESFNKNFAKFSNLKIPNFRSFHHLLEWFMLLPYNKFFMIYINISLIKTWLNKYIIKCLIKNAVC